MKKNGWVVEVEYQSAGIDLKIDGELEKEAKRRKGRDGGSGYFFPASTRDVSFLFKDEKNADAFLQWAVKRLKRIRVKSAVHKREED